MLPPSAAGPILWVKDMGTELIAALMDGRIQRTADNISEWRDPECPFPMELSQAVYCSNPVSDIAILSWIERELRVARIGALDTNSTWKKEFSHKSDLRESINTNQELILSQFLWTYEMNAEILAMTSLNHQFAFVSMNQGVYLLNAEWEQADEIWRSEIPDWPKPWSNAIWKKNIRNGITGKIETIGNVETFVQSIFLEHSSLILFDERGSWIRLSIENGKEIGRGRLPFNGLNTGVWKGNEGWAIVEDNRRLHLLDSNFSIEQTHRVPGPVNHAIQSSLGWIWTGWRHDGSEKGIKDAKEIGLWIEENNGIAILSNDGNWHAFDN